MKVLVLGSHGQLGKKIIEAAPRKVDLFTFSRTELDIQSSDQLRDQFLKHQFNVVINCAAYTLVDKAETESHQAYAINRDAVGELAKICHDNSAFLVHFSTDYVFSGLESKPYVENQSLAPLGVYGLSKAQGEQKIQESGCNYSIIRTSWLYAEFGKNFLRTIAARLVMNSPVKVVADQVGTPTYAGDLAEYTWKILSSGSEQLRMKEVFHFSNEGVASWYDFAFEIGVLLGKTELVLPIKTEEYPTPAKRPQFSVFDKSKIKARLGFPIRHWKSALNECFLNYKEIEKL